VKREIKLPWWTGARPVHLIITMIKWIRTWSRSHALQLETRFLEYTREAAAIERESDHHQARLPSSSSLLISSLE